MARVEEIQDRYAHWSKLLRAAQRSRDPVLAAFYADKLRECEALADALNVPVRYLAQHEGAQ